MSAQERRLSAIGEAAAGVLRHTDYHLVRAEDVAAAVRLSREGQSGRRSAVWLYNEVKSRRVLVALAIRHAFAEFAERNGPLEPPGTPGSLVEARDLVTQALLVIARFHRAESFLTRQVQLGIGDIATSEKRQTAPQGPPAWPGDIGKVAAAGWSGRVIAYAEHLAPVLQAAATAVCLPTAKWVRESAEKLSHLAFDALTDDPEGPVDRQAAALSAHWYERHLVPLAGTWIHDLDVAERARDVARRTGAGTRAESDAQAGVVRALLDTGILLERAAREAAELTRLLSLPEARTENDLRARCDVLSRRGLALLRFGDLEAARESFESSLKIAENEKEPFCPAGEASSYAARARNNLGEVLVEEGRPVEGGAHIEQARTARADAASRTAGVSAAWRRYTLTAQAAARATVRSGQVVKGVRLAEAVVADRRERLGELGDINVVAARVSLGEALLEAGQPVEARHLLQEAGRHRADLIQPIAYWPGHDAVRLAQAELALEDGGSALRVLERSPVLDEWFARNVSFRLWAEARVTQAMAFSLGDEHTEACRSLDELTRLMAGARPDALVLSAWRALAEVRLRAGDPVGALVPLERARAAESRPGDPPGRARTLLLAARCADLCGDPVTAARHRTALSALRDDGLDPAHPVLLEARFDEAHRRFEEGRFDGLDELLAPLLDRTPLAHNRPPLGDGHPLLFRAVLLADHSGAVRMPQAPRQVLWEDV